MHLNHTSRIFFFKQEEHQGGAGDGTARAIDSGEDGDGTALKPTNHTLI